MKRYRKAYYRFIKASIIALGIVIITTWLIFDIVNNLWHEYLLITKGIAVSGEIIKVEEEYKDEGRGVVNVYYNYAYSFYLPTGVEIITGGESNELTDLPNPVEVVYLEKNPEINRIKSYLPSNVKIFIRKVVVLDGIAILLILIIGSVIFRIVLKELIKEFHKTNIKRLKTEHSSRDKQVDSKFSWTNKTKEQIVNANQQELNIREQIAQDQLKESPDLTLEEIDWLMQELP